MSRAILRSRWQNMLSRCYYPKAGSYKYYGARGITVCEEWRNSFEVFYQWAMENGFAPDLKLDRRENDGNYEPDNCRWATDTTQARNRRNFVGGPKFWIRNGKRRDPLAVRLGDRPHTISTETVLTIRARAAAGERTTVIAAQLGLKYATVRQIVSGKRRPHAVLNLNPQTP